MRFVSFKPSLLGLAAFSVAERPPRPHRAISVPVANFCSHNRVSSSGSGQCTSWRPHHDEESRGVKVSVWWDFENCNLPTGANVFKVAQTITAAVRVNGIKGPVTITAFGDVLQLSRTSQEALSETGISLSHVPQGGKNSTDRFLITDLMCWVTRNPPPAHLFLISSDGDFAGVLHRLRMSNYNILLSGYEERTPRVLCSAASIMWDWNALVRGNNSIGKHFNQPPDGPYKSWYGHYRTPLLDPFAASSSTTTTTEQQSCTIVKTAELQESNSNTISKVCPPIPGEVVKQIGLVLSLYPKGVAITELREQLSKRNVPLGKDFYGHKRFSTFLLSLPEILQVVPKGEGMFLVKACTHKKASSPKLSSENPEVVSVETAELQESNSNTISCSSKVCHPIPEEVVKQIGLVLSLYPKGAAITKLREQLSKRNVPLGKDFYGHKKFSSFLLSLPEILQVVPKGDGVFLVQACGHEMDEKASSPKLSSENPQVVSVEKKHQKLKQNGKDLKREFITQENSQESVPVTNEMEVKAKDKPVKENQLALTAGDDVTSSKEKDGFLNKLNRLWFGSPEMGLEHLPEKKRICGNGDEGKGVVSEGKVVDTELETQIASSTSIESAKEVKADTEVGDEKSKSPGLLSRVLKRFNNFFERKNTELCNAAATGAQVDDIFAKDSFWKDVDSFINSPRGFVVVSHSKSREALAKNLKDEGPSSLKPLDVSKMLDLASQLISDKKWIKENPSDDLPFRVTRFTEKSSCLRNPRASSVLRSIVVNISKSQCDEADDEKKSENNSVSQRPLERSRSEVIADCHKLIKKITEEHPGGYNMSYFKKEFLETFGYRLVYQNLGYPKLQSLIQMMPEARIEAGYIVPSSTPAPCESDSLELGSVSKKSHDHEPSVSDDETADKGAPGDERKKKKKAGEIERVLHVLGSWDSVEDFGKEKLVDGVLTSLREKPSDESRV